jgi:hypothetical protein
MRILLIIVVGLMLGGCQGTGAFLQGMSQGLSGTYYQNQVYQRQQYDALQRRLNAQRQAAAMERQAQAAERQANAVEMQQYGF